MRAGGEMTAQGAADVEQGRRLLISPRCSSRAPRRRRRILGRYHVPALHDLASKAWRWTYPPPEDRFPLGPSALLPPLAAFLLDAHLLLRYHHRAGWTALRRFFAFPLTCAIVVRYTLGPVLPTLRFEPAQPGTSSSFSSLWTIRPTGDEPTLGRDQASLYGYGCICVCWLLKAAELCLSRTPPALNGAMVELLEELEGGDGSVPGQDGGEGEEGNEDQVVSADDARKRVDSDAGLRPRRRAIKTQGDDATNGHSHTPASDPKKNTVTSDASPRPLPRFLPSTRIPLEVDLMLSGRLGGWAHGLPYPPGVRPVPLLPPPGSPAFAKLQARRRALIAQGALKAVVLFLALDVVNAVNKSTALLGRRANVGAPERLGGGVLAQTFPAEELGLFQRIVLVLVGGAAIPINTQCLYGVFVGLMLLPAYLAPTSRAVAHYTYADPAHWEPVSLFGGRVWAPGSLGRLWGREWHQCLRPLFLHNVARPVGRVLDAMGCGVDAPYQPDPRREGEAVDPAAPTAHPLLRAWRGRPGRALHRALTTLCIFFVSGVMHETGLLAAGRTRGERDVWRLVGLGERVPVPIYREQGVQDEDGDGIRKWDRGGLITLFFFLQGVGVILEQALEAFLSRDGRARVRVGGVLGSVWALCWFFGWGGTLYADACLRAGLLQSPGMPRFVGPAVSSLWARLGLGKGVA